MRLQARALRDKLGEQSLALRCLQGLQIDFCWLLLGEHSRADLRAEMVSPVAIQSIWRHPKAPGHHRHRYLMHQADLDLMPLLVRADSARGAELAHRIPLAKSVGELIRSLKPPNRNARGLS